jgi:hypothetical protein
MSSFGLEPEMVPDEIFLLASGHGLSVSWTWDVCEVGRQYSLMFSRGDGRVVYDECGFSFTELFADGKRFLNRYCKFIHCFDIRLSNNIIRVSLWSDVSFVLGVVSSIWSVFVVFLPVVQVTYSGVVCISNVWFFLLATRSNVRFE